jgi:soluble cytochrome b562
MVLWYGICSSHLRPHKKGGERMLIQSVSSNGSLWQTMRNDLWTLSQDLTALQAGQNSGNQDQIQISQEALQKAMTSFQNDISALQNGVNGSMSTGATNSSSADQTANPLQTLIQYIAAIRDLLTSGNQDQIQSAEKTLQNDISALQNSGQTVNLQV